MKHLIRDITYKIRGWNKVPSSITSLDDIYRILDGDEGSVKGSIECWGGLYDSKKNVPGSEIREILARHFPDTDRIKVDSFVSKDGGKEELYIEIYRMVVNRAGRSLDKFGRLELEIEKEELERERI